MKCTNLSEGEFAQNRLKCKQEITRGLLKQTNKQVGLKRSYIGSPKSVSSEERPCSDNSSSQSAVLPEVASSPLQPVWARRGFLPAGRQKRCSSHLANSTGEKTRDPELGCARVNSWGTFWLACALGG